MGNDASLINTLTEEIEENRPPRGRFIINFISAADIPCVDFAISNCDPYLKSYLCTSTSFDDGSPQYARISEVVQTPRRNNCTSALWNSYRDFRIDPPPNSFLAVELHDWNGEKSEKEPIGSVFIGTEIFTDEVAHNFLFNFHKVGNPKKNPHFSVTLRRAFIAVPAPIQKTIFLVRHGESKWNKAQSSGNMLSSILDRDHPLTERGIRQAQNLRKQWREEEQSRKDSIDLAMQGLEPNSPSLLDPPVPTGSHSLVIDSACFEADLLGMDSPIDNADGTTKASTLDSGTGTCTPNHPLSPAFSPPMASLSSTPHTYERESMLQAFLDREEGEGRECVSAFATNSCSVPINCSGNGNNSLTTSSKKSSSAQPAHHLLRVNSAHSVTPINNNSAPGDEEEGEGDEEEEEEGEAENTAAVPAVQLEGSSDGVAALSLSELAKQTAKIGAKFSSPLTLNQIKARKREYRRMFIHDADAVYCSPFTRAIETALVGLEGHKALLKSGIILNSTIREVKGVGGLDSVGVAVGPAIAERVAGELENKLGRARVDQLMLAQIVTDDAASPWWTGVSSFDSRQDQLERVGDFVSLARYCEASCPIFVGHSLFFKLFYSKNVSSLLGVIRPELSENLRLHRLGNASVLALTVLFSSQSDLACTILDSDLIFGKGFQKHGSGGSNNNTPIPSRILKTSGLSTVLEKATMFLKDPFLVDSTPEGDKEREGGRVSMSQNPYHPSSFKESLSSFAKNLINPGNL